MYAFLLSYYVLPVGKNHCAYSTFLVTCAKKFCALALVLVGLCMWSIALVCLDQKLGENFSPIGQVRQRSGFAKTKISSTTNTISFTPISGLRIYIRERITPSKHFGHVAPRANVRQLLMSSLPWTKLKLVCFLKNGQQSKRVDHFQQFQIAIFY